MRPAVIASPIPPEPDGPIVVFAITGKYETPTPPDEILLPADPDGKLGTFVKKDCVVACWWANVVKKSEVGDPVGELSVPQIRIMTHFLRNVKAQMATRDQHGN